MNELTKSIILPTMWGQFKATSLKDYQTTHLLLQFGNLDPTRPVLTRIHSCCCFGDVFGGISCDCRAQLEKSIRLIVKEGCGLIFYLNQEGRGLGLAAKIEAIMVEQTEHVDTVDAFSRLHYPLDPRNYKVVSDTLKSMDIRYVRLLTNNPLKCAPLENDGINVTREPLITTPTAHSMGYLRAKVERMGHLWEPTLELQESAE